MKRILFILAIALIPFWGIGQNSADSVCLFPSKKAMFIGGDSAQAEFIKKGLFIGQVPKNLAQGTFQVQMVVEKNGLLSDVMVTKGMDEVINLKLLKVIRSMPVWNPAKNNGKVVRSYVRFLVDVDFKTGNVKIDDSDLRQEDLLYSAEEANPEFPGGDSTKICFLRNNLKYPQLARESGIDGTVYVRFIVEKDGMLSKIRILRGIGGGCDEEVIRIIKLMPKWIPGKIIGKPVRTEYLFPVKFVLD